MRFVDHRNQTRAKPLDLLLQQGDVSASGKGGDGKLPGWAPTTSSVLTPIEPVEPRMEILFIG